MITSRREFFDTLHKDYTKVDEKGMPIGKENSFLYDFKKRQKDKLAYEWLRMTDQKNVKKDLAKESKKTRPDRYLLLQKAFVAQKKGALPFQTYAEILGKLSGESKDIIRKWKKPADCEQEHAACAKESLIKECDRFFYDLGYRTDNQKQAARKDYSILDLFFALEKRDPAQEAILKTVARDRNGSADSNRTDLKDDPQYIEACDLLYQTLNNHPLSGRKNDFFVNRNIYIPIYIDAQSGAQIAFIGADRYGKQASKKKHVVISGLFFDGIDSVYAGSLPINMAELDQYESVYKAFDETDGFLNNDSDFYESYIDLYKKKEEPKANEKKLFEVRDNDNTADPEACYKKLFGMVNEVDEEAGELLEKRFWPFFLKKESKDDHTIQEEADKEKLAIRKSEEARKREAVS